MITTDSPAKDIEAGIEWLKEGGTFPFESVVFFVDRSSTPPVLNVDSYSACIHLENIHEKEAKEKIDRSKKVGEYLAASYPAFTEIWISLPRRFSFCYDYGKGAVLVASEEKGTFQWHKK